MHDDVVKSIGSVALGYYGLCDCVVKCYAYGIENLTITACAPASLTTPDGQGLGLVGAHRNTVYFLDPEVLTRATWDSQPDRAGKGSIRR